MTTLLLLIHRDVRDSLRSRWLIIYAATFAVLGALVAWGGAQASDITGQQGFGPIVAQFIALIMLFAPLMGLTLGAQSVVRDRERGVLAYLLAQPVAHWQYFLSKVIALSLSLCSAVLFGFAAVAITMAVSGDGGDLLNFAVLLLLTWLLTVVMAMIGLLVSVLVTRAPAALGIAIALWFAFAIMGDLGLMATAMTTHLGIGPLLGMTLMNPVEAFKIAAVAQLSGSLDALGPGGRLATDIFGGWLIPVTIAALGVWLVLALAPAAYMFKKRDAI